MKRGLVSRWSLRRSSSGVSEIVGDVLLVSIAVVMVATLAAQLGTVSDPGEKMMASLSASYDGQNVSLLHKGGDALQNFTTRFYLFSNDTLKATHTVADGLNGSERFIIGQSWTVNFASNSTERVRLQVIDTRSSVIIFDKILQRGPETAELPDLGLTPADIDLVHENATVNETTNAPMTNDTITVNITIHNYGGSAVPNVQVRITDYSTLDLRTFEVANRTIPLLNASSAVNITMPYRIENGSWGLHSLNVKIVPVFNESRYANNYASKGYRVGYPVMAAHPTKPFLRIRNIDFSTDHPVHGSTIVISSRISNQGGVPANATVRYYDNTKGTLIGTDPGLGIAVGGESLSSVFWKTTAGGLHTIIVNVTDPNGTGDERTAQIEVLSTILVVDDDRASEGSARDVVTAMLAGLQAVGASYNVHTVGGGDGPMYDGGEHPLRDYDLVIWMSGFESTNTLTLNDRGYLTRYLYETHGKFWLIGQDVINDLGYGNAFLGAAFGLDPATPYALDLGTPATIQGAEILTGTNISFTDPFTGGLVNKGDYVQETAVSALAFVEQAGPNRPLGLLFNATTNGSSDTYMSSLFTFELGKVESPNDRSLMIYSMLEWFNCSARWGRDLAISDQKFNITNPSFMEKVNITVCIRNNGLTPEPPDFVSPIVQVGFYIDNKTFDPDNVTVDDGTNLYSFSYPTSEIWIPQSTPDPGMVIAGRGGFIKVSLVWVANKVGMHNVTVKVDPYDYIDENNELNNQVASSISDGRIFVRYGTLIVDDDTSANNGGAGYNATANVSKALDALGYSYDLYEVVGAGSDGPGLSKLEQYNAILWCAGEAVTPLTAADQANLEGYLKKSDGRNLWLIAQDGVPAGNYFDGSSEFYRDFLRVARSLDPSAPKTPARILGVNQDPVSHGMLLPATATFADSGGQLVPYIDGMGIFTQSPLADPTALNRMVYSDGEDRATGGWYNRITPPATTNTIKNEDDAARGSRVITLQRTGVNVLDSSFLVGEHGPATDLNPKDLAWLDRDRATAQWSFSFPMDYTFGWHVTDTSNTHHIIYYTNADANLTGADPEFGLGAWTADGVWHTVTRDLLLDLREGTGNGALVIRSVDGFEVWMNEGTGKIDDLLLCRPFSSVRFDNTVLNYKTVFTSWDLSFASYTGNVNYSAELAYMVMRWFNLYDERTELRVTFQDLYYGSLVPIRQMKPMIGESYVMKAMVWNPGGTRGDTVVRFMDGTTVIDSVTVSVDASSRAIAEIVWTPLFAGSRTIGAIVDPDNAVTEVMKFNNYAGVNVQCYFFYDDMENGATNWKHDATLARINGESPLEYMDPGAVNTNIVRSWDASLGVCATTSDYHTYPTSYRMLTPAVADYTYTFFLTYDPWSATFRQGFYVVAIQKEAVYTVERFNTASLEYDTLYTNTLAKGLIAIYPNQQANALYRIHSYGPLLVVITSAEGSNVNVANCDNGLGRGQNFTVMGDLANTLGAGGDTHVAAVALEANTVVTVKWIAITPPSNYGAQVGVTQTQTLVSAGDRFRFVCSWAHSYVVANITADKPILVYRMSNDNDELDNAMAMTGYTYGKELYFVMYKSQGGWNWRFLISNLDDAQALDIDIYESTALSGWGGWSLLNQRVDPHSSRVFSRVGPPGDGNVHYFRITSDRNITVIFGQEQNGNHAFANDCPMVGADFFVDGVWDYRLVTEQPGFYRMSTPQLYARTSSQGSNRLYNLYQDFSFGSAITIDIDPGLPVLGSANGVNQNGLRYISTVPLYITVKGVGPLGLNGSQLDGAGWTAYDLDGDGYANFTLPAGAHTYLWRTTFGGGGGLYIVRIGTDRGGEVAWQLWPTIGDPPGTGFDESTSHFTDGNFWNFTASHRFLYLVGGSGNCWIHTILPFEGAVETPGIMRAVDGGAREPGNRETGTGAEGGAGGRANEDFYITTAPFSLAGYASAELSFYQKYSMQVGANGVVIMVGNDTAGDNNYKYRYVTPTRPYTGNIRFDIPASRIRDDFGREMRWCFNGVSTNGLGQWDYITVDLSQFIGQVHVKVKFVYINATMTSVGYWYVDDVVVRAGRGDLAPSSNSVDDQWELVTRGTSLGGTDTADSYGGRKAWLCHDPSAGVDYLKGGVDNSLTTVPIDLTNALDASLDVKFKFNINSADGRPPDGFRVEVSADNGESWQALNRGVRSSSGVSGSVAAGGDGTSITGVELGDSWVSSKTMSRLNCDLSGWAGKVILLRFRVVTRTDTANHYDSAVAGFGGVYVDDVKVIGNTTTGGRGFAGAAGPGAPAGEAAPSVAGPEGDGGSAGGNGRDVIPSYNEDNRDSCGAGTPMLAAAVRTGRYPEIGGGSQ
jgi:hypothetical protein